jgi:hypothetical protein
MINIAAPILLLIAHMIHASAQVHGPKSPDGLSLTLKLKEFSRSRITMELTLKNTTSGEIYFATNPSDLDGKLGLYIDAVDSDTSVMFLSSQVYPPVPFFLYSDETSVKLKRLGPSETVAIPVVLNAPFKETDPPFAASVMTKKNVFTLGKVKRIVVAVGYFPADGMSNFPNRRVKGTAQVRLTDGRRMTLVELQRVAVAELAMH